MHGDPPDLIMETFCKAVRRAGLAVAMYVYATSTVWSQERFALIVGTDGFPGTAKLAAPAKDAFNVSAAMIGLGFNVRRLRNPTREDVWTTIESVGKQDRPVLFFYSGPVFAVDGKTYLVPSDIGDVDAADASSKAILLDDIVSALSAATLQEIAVILEACHDLGAISFPGQGQIAMPNPGQVGVFYGFSQAPGKACDPAEPPHPRITGSLLAGLKRPNLSIGDLLTSKEGTAGTGPWIQDNLTSAFVPNQRVTGAPILIPTAKNAIADGGGGIVVALPPQTETIVITAPVRPVVFATASAPIVSGTQQFGANSNSGVVVFVAAAPMRPDFDTQVDAGLPEPSVIVGRLRPTLASFPTVDLGLEDDDRALTGQELLFSDRDARNQLRQENPDLYLTLLESGMFDPPEDQLVRAIQTELSRINCLASRVDGSWGRNSRSSVGRFYAEIGEPVPSADPTLEIYRKILSRDGVVCTAVRAASTDRQPARNTAQRPAATAPAATAPAGRRIINPSAVGVTR